MRAEIGPETVQDRGKLLLFTCRKSHTSLIPKLVSVKVTLYSIMAVIWYYFTEFGTFGGQLRHSV